MWGVEEGVLDGEVGEGGGEGRSVEMRGVVGVRCWFLLEKGRIGRVARGRRRSKRNRGGRVFRRSDGVRGAARRSGGIAAVPRGREGGGGGNFAGRPIRGWSGGGDGGRRLVGGTGEAPILLVAAARLLPGTKKGSHSEPLQNDFFSVLLMQQHNAISAKKAVYLE